MSERELLEAENILYKADRLSLTIIRLRIPVTRDNLTTCLLVIERSVEERWRRCPKN